MRSYFIKSALVVLAFVSVAGVAKADNIVSNPNFSYTNYSFPGYAASGTQINGWTGTGNYGATGFNVGGFWNNGTLPSGIDSVGFIQINGTLSTQLNNLTVGQLYSLTFLDNSRSSDGPNCCNATPFISVSVGGDVLVSGLSDAAVGGTNPFRSFSSTFIAKNASETLQLSANTGGADGTALFSAVGVNAVTPEPSSLMLLGTGALGLVGAVRRRLS